MEENQKTLLYQIKPKFNLIYEIFIPENRQIRKLVFSLFSFLTVTIIYNIWLFFTKAGEHIRSVDTENIAINMNLLLFVLILIPLTVIAIRSFFKIMQYKRITYDFYSEYLEYKDTFLNQKEKTIVYKNIREVEIIKTIIDRIMKYGTIKIYTNAEKDNENGFVISSIKNPQEVYNKIDNIIHNKNTISNIQSLESQNLHESFNDTINKKNET